MSALGRRTSFDDPMRRVFGALVVVVACAGCAFSRERSDTSLAIPSESDWHEVGPVLEAGPEGAWDQLLAGASSPSTLLWREDRWWLFYGGADGLRQFDSGPRHRAIGLATSRDGVRFERVGDAPVVEYRPTGGEEEGANSAAVLLGPDDNFVMHYGAATQFLPDQIYADVRLARSIDGVHFEDAGLVLSHTDKAVYGFGDELFPLASYRYGGNWYVFYVPNGSAESRDLAIAWGLDELALEHSRLVVDGSPQEPARCAANVIVDGDRIIVFVQRGWVPEIRAEVRISPADAPWDLGPPLRVWDGPLFRENTKSFTVALDRERQTWLLYRLDWNNRFVLHTAPSGARDTTPPTAPSQLSAVRTSERVQLAWDEARDPETGIAQYRVRCGGTLVGESLSLGWAGATDATQCAISAVNLHGVEGPPANVAFEAPDSGN